METETTASVIVESTEIRTESHSETTIDGAEKKKKSRPEGKEKKKLRRKKKHDSSKENGAARATSGDGGRIHVRSFDSAKAIKKFSKLPSGGESAKDCRTCGREVFQMECIKAEKAVFHKNCFRCVECDKQLTLDTYASHERQLYCKPHHKMLLKPKPVENSEERVAVPRRYDLIIRESQPEELPPDVIRSSSKSDYGLGELQNLNMKDRFSKFEHGGDDEQNQGSAAVEVKRSRSMLKKMKKFLDGQDAPEGVELSNGSDEEESEESGDEGDDVGRDPDVVRSTKRTERTRPEGLANLGEVKNKFEQEEGHERRERMRLERKGEMAKLRGMICGARDRKQVYQESVAQEAELKRLVPDPKAEIQSLNLKAYEEALKEADSPLPDRAADVTRQVTTDIASKFERGEVSLGDEDAETRRRREEDEALFKEAGTARGARSLFKQLDAGEQKEQPHTGVVRRSQSSTGKTEFRRSLYESQPVGEVVKSTAKTAHDDIHIETSALSNKFKFFETYKEPELKKERFRFSPPREGTVKGGSPDREIERDPSIVRADDGPYSGPVVRSSTASQLLNKFKQLEQGIEEKESLPKVRVEGNARSMLSVFRQMEEDAQREDTHNGPKPLKSFTPPPEYTEETDSDSEYTYTDDSEYSDSGSESESGIVRSRSQVDDEFLAQRTDRARALKAKFERWEHNMERQNKFDAEEEIKPGLESARNLRSMFEAMKDQPTLPEKPQPKVNRFI